MFISLLYLIFNQQNRRLEKEERKRNLEKNGLKAPHSAHVGDGEEARGVAKVEALVKGMKVREDSAGEASKGRLRDVRESDGLDLLAQCIHDARCAVGGE